MPQKPQALGGGGAAQSGHAAFAGAASPRSAANQSRKETPPLASR